MQLHFRILLFSEAKLGFVCISSALIADSRSLSAVDAPCIGVPPATLILALGFGDEVLDLTSEINWPAADGGSLPCGGAGDGPRDLGVAAPEDIAVVGNRKASEVSDKPNAFDLDTFGFECPAI